MNERNLVPKRAFTEVPQFSIWWFDFPGQGRHPGLVLTSDQYNTVTKHAIVAAFTSSLQQNKYFYSFEINIRGKLSVCKLNDTYTMSLSALKPGDFMGMITDPDAVAGIKDLMTHMFDSSVKYSEEPALVTETVINDISVTKQYVYNAPEGCSMVTSRMVESAQKLGHIPHQQMLTRSHATSTERTSLTYSLKSKIPNNTVNNIDNHVSTLSFNDFCGGYKLPSDLSKLSFDDFWGLVEHINSSGLYEIVLCSLVKSITVDTVRRLESMDNPKCLLWIMATIPINGMKGFSAAITPVYSPMIIASIRHAIFKRLEYFGVNKRLISAVDSARFQIGKPLSKHKTLLLDKFNHLTDSV